MIEAVAELVNPLIKARALFDDDPCASFPPLVKPGPDASAFERIAYIWLKGNIQLAELAFCMVVTPGIAIWLLLPMRTFENAAFVYMAVIPEEIWGLYMLLISTVWYFGVTNQKIHLRMVGSFLTATLYLAISLSMGLAKIAVIGVPLFFALSLIVGFLCVRQGWETGRGES